MRVICEKQCEHALVCLSGLYKNLLLCPICCRFYRLYESYDEVYLPCKLSKGACKQLHYSWVTCESMAHFDTQFCVGIAILNCVQCGGIDVHTFRL